ncbi:MAG: NAD(+)--rifampin ADP-ribosyltransferase [Roseovarius sp.]|uniref:NAD(+)--rifampin ADP-ribosyltransferase n=1 Tax=Roseovarius sp. TaxID=1486281 RepID=UPI0032EDED08
MTPADHPHSGPWYHGTRAHLGPGDLITAGRASNFGSRKPMSWVYFTGTLDAAIWGAELAAGDARQRIYIVEPTGPYEPDPNLTDQRFPGNPTLSFRSRDPLRILGEVAEWEGHTPEQLQAMHDGLARLKAQGIEAID